MAHLKLNSSWLAHALLAAIVIYVLAGFTLAQNPGAVIYALTAGLALVGVALVLILRAVQSIDTRLRNQIERPSIGIAQSILEGVTTVSPPPSIPQPALEPRAELSALLESRAWPEVEARMEHWRVIVSDHEWQGLSAQVTRHKLGVGATLSGQIAAARQANDLDRVLEIFEQLRPLLTPEQRGEQDPQIVQWSMALLMRRLRTGTVSEEVVALAARLADNFAHTPQGASLRAALPTLRRSAGLCGRCGQPYAGIEDACPNCLARPKLHDDLKDDTPDAPTNTAGNRASDSDEPLRIFAE